MEQVCETKITELLVDGGPTKNMYLMQFQCDILAGRMRISNTEELSVIGAAYLAGITKGCMDKEVVFSKSTDNLQRCRKGRNVPDLGIKNDCKIPSCGSIPLFRRKARGKY